MQRNRKVVLRKLRIWWCHNKRSIASVSLHGITAAAFGLVYLGMLHWLPGNLGVPELENSVQLLGQVLAIVVGVLLLGATISLSSYSGAASIVETQSEIDSSCDAFFEKFFASSNKDRHKLESLDFLRYLLSKPQVNTLLFKSLSEDQSEGGWFIYRPNWDGVWYQIKNSPFADRDDKSLSRIQVLHEVVITAHLVLKAVVTLRESGSSLVGRNEGTNGARSFIEHLDDLSRQGKLELPSEMPIKTAMELVCLAMLSEHYMREEFRDHTDNVNWDPFILTTFQLHFLDYAKSLMQFVAKLQYLRWQFVLQRYPLWASKVNEKDLLSIETISRARELIWVVRRKVVSAHGASAYFNSIRRWSILGIGLSLLVLLSLLCGWPYLRWVADPATRLHGFILLYSAGIASLVESTVFILRLLWGRRLAT